MPAVEILSLVPEHAAALANLEAQCFATPWSEASLQEFLLSDLSAGIGATADGVLIGYIGMYLVAGEAQITNIAVLEPFRRAKVGRRLLQAAICKAVQASCFVMTLEVRQSNCVAVAFYESMGFSHCGTRKNYYMHPREDALIYSLALFRDTLPVEKEPDAAIRHTDA